ncbi:MAG: signal recognition particle-docking protein FtsY, partial [Myxococcales bacterium]|nr:signal recognition particle-docking protein FtsY [Myxococcales bacterium]
AHRTKAEREADARAEADGHGEARAEAREPGTRDRKPGKGKGKGKAARPRTPEPEERDEDEVEDEGDDQVEAAAPDDDARAAYKAGLAKTRGGFVAKLGKLFGKKKIDADVLEGLEEVLFTADIGPRAADRIFQDVKGNLSKDDLEDASKIWRQIRKTSATILDVGAPAVDVDAHHPFVLLTIGVNGVGKTTTIGKLAALLSRQGKKVLLAAGDTFRAAATEQLEIWGQRAGCPVVKGKSGGDPSSVIFEAIKRGVDEDYDVVICDTAGRLHTKVELMDELKKVRRVCEKAMPGSPHETWLVLDATTGQNAIQQAKTFKETMEITGLVLTKLDGSAKGGVVLGICDELKVPVRYIGVGEKVDDLRPFDPAAFVAALYDDAEHADAA